jgi:hypothetical protein
LKKGTIRSERLGRSISKPLLAHSHISGSSFSVFGAAIAKAR